MPTYLAFLRAVNLGPTRVFPKDDIRRVVESVGFEDAVTHINTGNVRFATRMRSHEKIERMLAAAFQADRGFAVPTMVFSATEFARIAADGHALAAEHPGIARHDVHLLAHEPTAEARARVEATASDRGRVVVRGRAAHALLEPGYQDGRVDQLGAAKLLEPATSRAFTVVAALAEKWC